MTAEIDWAALAVFLVLLGLVTALGFGAARWRRPKTLAHLEEWGLGGRQFGTWITWLSMAETNCAKWRRESVPVGLREKGFEAPAWCFCVDLNFVGGLSFIRCF